MKKTVLLVLIVTMIVAAIPVQAGFSMEFYKARDAYDAAAKCGDDVGICTNVEKMLALIPNPSDVAEYRSTIWAIYKAGLAYERLGNYEKAKEFYNKYIEYARWLEKEAGEDHSENIKGFQTLLDHMSLRPQLYFESYDPADALYYGAKYENIYGTFSGMGTASGEIDEDCCNAFTLYITFFNEYIADAYYRIPENLEYLQIGWNVPNENFGELESIANGSYDSYIETNLRALTERSEKVLLRFGAEVNVWSAIPSDAAQREKCIEIYKRAYRRIADMARRISPNVAMVYSPNDVSNWYVDSAAFYPGDEYVDWIGISCYPNKVSGASGKVGDYSDAFYCRGAYENPLMRLKDVVDNFGDRKPIFISECGFAYGHDGVQTTEHALEMCEYFYTYVNMVYPQIKGVIYFNHNFRKDFSLENNIQLKEKYRECVAENIGIQASLNGTSRGYSKFNTIKEKLDELVLCTHAYYANGMPVSVCYLLDGVEIPSESVIPYRATIDVNSLSKGGHTITQIIRSGATKESFDYSFNVAEDGKVTYVSGQNKEKPILSGNDNAQKSNSDIKVRVNRNLIMFDQTPVAENGRTLVPLRKIFEALRAEVEWNGETQTVTAYGNNRIIKLTLGENVMYVNGVEYELDVPAKAINGRTLVPVRAISQALDCIVDWDNSTKTVIIETQY